MKYRIAIGLLTLVIAVVLGIAKGAFGPERLQQGTTEQPTDDPAAGRTPAAPPPTSNDSRDPFKN